MPMNDPQDIAIRKRLARLANATVDTTELERRLGEVLSHADLPVASPASRRLWKILAVAAMLILSLSIASLFLFTDGDAAIPASAMMLSAVHDEVLEGDPGAMPASDLSEARRAIVARWSDAPAIPEFAVDNVASCCVHHVRERQLVCILGDVDGLPVTMVVAHARDFRPDHESGVMNQEGFCCHTHGQQNMVCKKVGERTICLVSELPRDRLVSLAKASGL